MGASGSTSLAVSVVDVKDGDSCRVRGQVTGTVKKQFVCVWATTSTKSGRVLGRRLVWELKVVLPTTTTTSTSSTTPLPLSCAKGGECRVGDVGAGGGVVFYVPATPQWWGRYMEAAPNPWFGSGDARYTAGCHGLSIFDARAVGIGSGKRNTELIVAACPEPDIAARVAYDLVLNGKSDWFLPSRDELNAMWPHRVAIGARVDQNNQPYASSTWPNANDYSAQMFTEDKGNPGFYSGRQFDAPRTFYNYFVRPIRYGE